MLNEMEATNSSKDEAMLFDKLEKYRNRCIELWCNGSDNEKTKVSETVNFSERISEIMQHEEVVCEMWKRLDMDLRKGDPSYPLRVLERETPISTYTFLQTFGDILYGSDQGQSHARENKD